MTGQKAWYWLAAGIVALGLNSEYQSGGLPNAHRLIERSGIVLAQVTGRAHSTFELAKMLMGRDDVQLAPEVEVAELPGGVDVADSDTAVEFADRTEAMSDLATARAQVRVDCAKAALDKAIAAQQMSRLQPKLDQLQFKLEQASLKIDNARL